MTDFRFRPGKEPPEGMVPGLVYSRSIIPTARSLRTARLRAHRNALFSSGTAAITTTTFASAVTGDAVQRFSRSMADETCRRCLSGLSIVRCGLCRRH